MCNFRLRPRVYVGSSQEGRRIAQAVQALLDPVCEVEIWDQGVFGLGQGTLESLVRALEDFDFAVLVLTADDLIIMRGDERPVARDNVVFELGLFIGALGRDRTFMVYDRTHPPALPSDLAGVTAATYEPHTTGNLLAALGPPCFLIQNAIERLGARESRRVQRLEKATETIDSAGTLVRDLVRLLARSRKVELDVVLAQLGSQIDPRRLEEIREDFRDLEEILSRDGI